MTQDDELAIFDEGIRTVSWMSEVGYTGCRGYIPDLGPWGQRIAELPSARPPAGIALDERGGTD